MTTLIERITGKQRAGAFLLVAASLLSYVLGGFLIARFSPDAHLGLKVDRDQAIDLARAFARTGGVPADQWGAFARVEENRDVSRYLALHPAGPFAPLRNALPRAYWRLLLAPADRSQGFEVRLTPDGRPFEFFRYFPEDLKAVDVGESSGLPLATAELHRQVGNESLLYSYAGSTVENKGAAQVRTFTWRRSFPERPELTLVTAVSVTGTDTTAYRRKIEIAPEFVKALPQLAATDRERVTGILTLVIMLFLVVYGIVRLIGRAREHEVPYRRSILLGLLVFGSLLVMTFLGADQAWATHGELESRTAYLSWPIPLLILAGAIGLGWGASEGDVRERIPGKLTSFDALLGGRWFSRNVGRSILAGFLLGGFVTLANGVVASIGASQAHGWTGLGEDTSMFFAARSFPLLLVAQLFASVVLAPIGSLVALSFFSRWFRSTRTLAKVLGLFLALFVFLGALQNYEPSWLAFVAGLVYAGSIVFPFFLHDLTAVVATSVFSGWVGVSIPLFLTPAPSLLAHGMTLVLATLLLLTLGVAGSLRGRELSEVEVRPSYARNIAERLSLQAELHAAREAQLRLIPRRVPVLSNGSIAAVCKPALEVSGDYYDFLPFPDGRLGIVLADSKGEGLSSALGVSMLKGLLVSYILTQKEPAAIVQKAIVHLRKVFGTELPFSFFFAAFDSSRDTLEYARFGATPALLHMSAAGTRLVTVASSDEVVSGTLELHVGESFLLYSDGIPGAKSSELVRLGDDSLLKAFSDAESEGAQSLIDRLFRVVERHTKGAQQADDDRTVVALSVVPGAGDFLSRHAEPA